MIIQKHVLIIISKYHVNSCSVDDCPTDENPKVNFYGEQSENPYCQVNIDGDKCVEKENHVSNSCQYNYLKDGGESNDNYSKNCTEVELLVKEGNETRMVQGSFLEKIYHVHC